MKPTLFAVVALCWTAAASAQNNPVPTPIGTPGASQNTPAAPTKKGDSFAIADRNLGELNRGNNQLAECVAAYEYLAASAAKAEKKYTAADGTVPSHIAALIPMKRKMADDKRVACIAQGSALGNRFSAIRSEFADFEPRNSKGLAARRLELTELRGKCNALMQRLGGKPAKPTAGAPRPTKASEADEPASGEGE